MLALLVEAAARNLALGLVVWVGFRIWGKAGPRTEMLAWIAVLGASLAMPVLMQWSLPIVVPSAASQVLQKSRDFVSLASLPISSNEIAQTVTDAVTSPFLEKNERIPAWTVPWGFLTVAAYGTITLLMLLRLAFGVLRGLRLVKRARPILGHATAGLNVRTSREISAPMSFAGTVLVPHDYLSWPAFKLQAVLAHEAAHIARGDFYVLIAAAINRALFWFSPLSWWLFSHLSALAEDASDAAAIARVGEPASYAEVLLDFARFGSRPATLCIPMARPNMIVKRIESILSGAAQLRETSAAKQALTFASVLAVVGVAACVQVPTPSFAALDAVEPQAPRTIEGITFSGSGTMRITIGAPQSLDITGDVETSVHGGMLYIAQQKGSRRKLTVNVTVPRLQAIKLSGKGDIHVEDFAGGDTAIDISGAGTVDATGRLDKLRLTISGSASADLPGLTIDDAVVRISGSGDVVVKARQALDAVVSGSGTIRYIGSPPRLSTTVSGSGTIKPAT